MIAEIAGVTGTGKSTIVQAITQRDCGIQTNYDLKWWQFLPVYYIRAALATPIYFVRYRGTGQVFWWVLRWMTYLEKLHHTLSMLGNDNRVLLDQGPVYWFTFFQVFVPDYIQDEWFTRWWNRELESWSSILNTVFFLECDDAILIERIRNRSKKHRIKGLPDLEAREFLARYREGYQDVLARLTASDGPRVYHLSTDRESPKRIADQIQIELLADCAC